MNIFNNTEIAFISKSNADLRKAQFLFKILSKPSFIKILKFFTFLAFKIRLPIAFLIKSTVYKQFVGGKTINDCSKTIKLLGKYNVKAILDYSIESTSSIALIEKIVAEIVLTIEFAKHNKNIAFAVFKPSAIIQHEVLKKICTSLKLNNEEQIEANNFKIRFNKICQTAYNNQIPVLIDAEYYEYQSYFDSIVLEMMLIYNKQKAIVFNTIQMYRIDRLKYFSDLIEQAKLLNFKIGIKLVRGAYMDYEREQSKILNYNDPIHKTKIETDNAFNEALKLSIKNRNYVAIFCGTHNEESCKLLIDLMLDYQIKNDDQHIFFSQLYGMSDHISFNLAMLGYNVAKYIPYGEIIDVIPYLMRRAEENAAIAGQTTRELDFIKTEINRRKAKRANL